jgi:hypothetical protein
MDQKRPAKIIVNAKPEGRRNRRRPKLRWEDVLGKETSKT